MDTEKFYHVLGKRARGVYGYKQGNSILYQFMWWIENGKFTDEQLETLAAADARETKVLMQRSIKKIGGETEPEWKRLKRVCKRLDLVRERKKENEQKDSGTDQAGISGRDAGGTD